ncbi:MAG: hypothetical protein B6I24_01875 [Bacteroidetes bacterium 4572_128]|nr:MAG: hypothetical protein B6I24_01875 [Bacteroidetes bacterium 4572_128]
MKNNVSVLIVDDNIDNLQIVSNFIQKSHRNYKISISTNGEHALNSIKRSKPDLILLDVMMPNMDGFEVCKILKKNEKTKNIPIIFLTAKEETVDIVKGLKIGGADYVLKPFNFQELLARMETQISLKLSQDKIKRDLKKINNLNEKLKKANSTKDKMLAVIGHELRNPIGNFKMFLDLLTHKNHKINEIKKQRILGLMKENANFTYNLLENLLFWAKTQDDEISFLPKKLNIKKLTNEIISNFSISIEKKSIKIINDIEKDFEIIADKNMLLTIFRNLISNSIKFCFENGKIKISLKKHKEFLEFIVSDNGVGISKKNIDKIFDKNKNFTTYGTQEEKGTGIGIDLCRIFVEKHKGEIWVESAENKGANFHFKIANNL